MTTQHIIAAEAKEVLPFHPEDQTLALCLRQELKPGYSVVAEIARVGAEEGQREKRLGATRGMGKGQRSLVAVHGEAQRAQGAVAAECQGEVAAESW